MPKKTRAAARNEPGHPRAVRPEPGAARQRSDLASGVLPRLREIAGQLQEVIARLESIIDQLAGPRPGDQSGRLVNGATAGEANDWPGRAMIFLRKGAVG